MRHTLLLTTAALACALLARMVQAEEPTYTPELIAQITAKAEAGNAEQQYQLAECYRYGQGVPGDDTQAFLWYRKSAEQDNIKSQFALGEIYILTLEQTSLTHDQTNTFQEAGVKWFHRAADQGSVKAFGTGQNLWRR